MRLSRRDFVVIGSAAALDGALAGCALRCTEGDRLLTAMRRQTDDGLYRGLVCCSNVRREPAAVGRRTLGDDSLSVDAGSLFDLASVGKTQTAALCARLYAEGKLDPDAPFTEYLGEHVLAKENCRITVRDLATHTGGFDNSKPYMTPDPRLHFERLFAKRPVRPRGVRFEYACSNFVYLGLIVEKLTGLDLDAAARKLLWGPLGMDRTTWNTCVGDDNVVEYPKSTYDGPRRQIGEHNDVCAHYAPRPMGNGSCFSTGPDMLKFVSDFIDRRTFPREYYDLQLRPSACIDGHRRSFGWDMTAAKSTFSSWTATRFSDQAICHTGWTGSAIAVDPECGFAGVVLGNRLASKEATMGPRMELLDIMRSDAIRWQS